MRDMINKSLELISFFIVFILFFSCTGEIGDETGSKTGAGGKVQIALQIPITAGDATSFTTRSEVDNESTIRNLTLFFFDSSGTKKFATYIDLSNINGSSSDVDMNRWANEKVITILNADILAQLSESRNVHVVANYGNISNTAKEADLNDIITNSINTDISSPTEDKPLVMHGADLNHVFVTNSKATVSLVRNVAKVQMTLTTTDFTLGGKKISLAPESTSPSALSSVKVINQADRSFLVSKGSNPSRALTPPNITYFNGANTTAAVNSRTTPGITTFVSHINYINENLRESYSVETNATALILQIPYRIDGGEIKKDNYYKVLINNIDGNDKYKINRNTIYDITASISTLGGETDASAVLVKGTLNVLPWDENTLTSDLTQTSLWVERSLVQIGVNGTLTYSTNALFSSDPQLSECSVITTDTPSWLTVSLASANQVNLKASTEDGYRGDTRTGTFKLKVKNLIKVITVIQALSPVTDGSISLTPRRLFLPEKPRNALLTLTPTNSRWLMVGVRGDASVATCNPTSGAGSGTSTTLTFTNGTSYGNTYYKFANLNTMKYDSIQVCNLYLSVPSSIEISGQGETISADISALGGDADWKVKSTSGSWLTATKVNGVLSVTATEGPLGQERTGTITIAHVNANANDVDYTKIINVTQRIHIKIPDFDYLLLRYDWTGTGGTDLDMATEFTNTNLKNVDDRPLGYGLYGDAKGSNNGNDATFSNPVNLGTKGDQNGAQITDPSSTLKNTYPILVWGGDNTSINQRESVYINVKNLCSAANYNILPIFINISLYAVWWNKVSETPIKIEMTAYKGGTMERDNSKNFFNNGGNQVYTNASNLPTRKISGPTVQSPKSYRTKFIKVGYVTFNKTNGTANIEIYSDASTKVVTRATSISSTPQLKGESKDDYSLRLEKYYNNKK